MTLAARLRGGYTPEPNTGCWLWDKALNESGYGVVWVNDRMLRAHRVMYELEKGPIPPGLLLDHLCRVRSCVNPQHLEPVTALENSRRGDCGAYQKARTHCPQGHEYTTANTYRYRKGNRGCRTCNRERTWLLRYGPTQLSLEV